MAESLTGGLIGTRITDVPGASDVLPGLVSCRYASEVKFDVLGVPEGPVVSERGASAMAVGACRVLGADVGVGGHRRGRARRAGGPARRAPCAWRSRSVETSSPRCVRLPGDRPRIRQFATITLLDLLRRRLLET